MNAAPMVSLCGCLSILHDGAELDVLRHDVDPCNSLTCDETLERADGQVTLVTST